MIIFTEEEKGVVWMAQSIEKDRTHVKPERIPCIEKIIEFIVKDPDREVREVMNQARRELAMLSDEEYAAYDFGSDDKAVAGQ